MLFSEGPGSTAPELSRATRISLFKRQASLTLIVCIILMVLLGAYIGRVSQPDVQTWYLSLNKSPFTPPNWAFAAAWTFLYALLGYSFARLLMKTVQPEREKSRRKALWVFVCQLLANFAWNPLFFKLHLLWLSAAWIYVVLWLSVWSFLTAYKIDGKAAAALLPLLAWLFFACYLMTWIYLNN